MLKHAEHTAMAQRPGSGRLSNWLRPGFVLILLVALAQGLIFARAMHAGTGGRWILPVDDSYIHQQYARQLARGYLFRYNDGDAPSSGATSLLYPFILAGAWRLGAGGDALSAFAFALGMVCLALSALLASRIASRLYVLSSRARPLSLYREVWAPRWVGLLAALLLLANGAIVWSVSAGMESGLFTVFLLATLEAFVAGRRRQVAIWGGLLAVTRPEGLLLGAAVAFLAALQALRSRRESGEGWSWLYVVPPLCGLLHPALNLALTGSVASNAVRAKSWLANVPFVPRDILLNLVGTARQIWLTYLTGVTSAGLHDLPRALLRRPGVALYLPPFLGALGLGYALLAALRAWRRRQCLAAATPAMWIVLGLSAAAVMRTATWQYYRYELPYFALGMLAAAPAVAQIAGSLGRDRLAARAFIGVGLMALLLSAYSIPAFAWRFQAAARTTLLQQVSLGEWVRANLPPGARVGVADAGAITYYGGHPIYDMVGLGGSLEASLAWPQGSGSVYEAMERSPDRPAYFAVYDDVHETPYYLHAGLFGQELYRTHDSQVAEVAYSDHQVVYQADWSLLNSGDRIHQADIARMVRGLRLTDALDVADLTAEREHGYRWWNVLPRGGFATELLRLTYRLPPAQEVLDGGRLLTGGEAFDLKTVPGEPLLLVGRFLGQSPVFLTVKINGRALGEWAYPAVPGRWQERTLPVPAEYVTGARTHVEIAVQAQRPGLEFHRPFYYWCYQGELPKAEAEIATRLDRRVGDSIVLLGRTMNLKATSSGYELDLDLFWQATRPAPGDYKVFVHWSDEQDTILTQQDNRPGYDLQPTWLWRAGQTVVDHYTLALPLDPRPPRRTILYVGMYDPATGSRLPIAGGDAANRLELARLTVPS